MLYGFKTKKTLNLFRFNKTETKTNPNKPETKANSISVFPVLPIFINNYRPCHLSAKSAIVSAAIKTKKYYDFKHQPKFFKIGDFVNLRFHRNYQLLSIKYPKINPQLTGRVKITERIGKLAYRLKIHDVISITHFEPTIEPVDDPHQWYKIPAPEIIINNYEKSEIEKLLQKKSNVGKIRLYNTFHGDWGINLNTINGSLNTVWTTREIL